MNSGSRSRGSRLLQLPNRCSSMVRLLSDAVASVIVMRHCLRSCPDVAKGGAPGFDWLANYTSPSHPMQPFEVEE